MIYRVERKENPFVQVDKGFINDTNIGYKEKGILLYFLSKPDGWKFYEGEVTAHSHDGLTAVRTGIQSLIKAGYIERQQLKAEHGKFAGYEYVVHETSPQCKLADEEKPFSGNPITENPKTDNPISEKPTLINNKVSNNDGINNRLKATIAEKSKDSPQDEPPVISLLLNDKSEYPVTQSRISEWKALYPAIDVMQELRSMKGWLIANPSNRKTKRGILRFINNWLSRAQNRAPRQGAATSPSFSNSDPWGGVNH